ncbi:hydroxyacid dehydrogenase [Roseomonas sp. OT10]|uniref:NAD(P)-dependent oxidoreductase n=1 Tax=Roseomonas cutis TaxID=2897332 RepID=UPI001E5524C9|nr:NAD(P)-dependent oxidoreductase [Roseomonas sp. OT10]UFN47135.1 hydroxyacid dehydrogenase [Roseomonas sp. OT10]
MRILLTHTPRDRDNYYGEEALAALRRQGELRLNTDSHPPDAARLATLAAGCQVIVADRQAAGDPAVFAALPDLVAFLRVAVDIRNIDLEAAGRHGVLVCRATPGFADSVAELAVGFLVDLARGISHSVCGYRGGQPPAARMGQQLSGATLGIIGYGVIGQRLAALAQALGMRVLVSDPHRQAGPGMEQLALPDLLARSRFLCCLAPATPETEGLLDAAAFAAMPRGSCLLNLSRGNLVDEAALEAALDRGHLAGAAMDVGRAPDQMPSPRLAGRPDVIATPHIGGLTPEAVRHQAFDTVRQVEALAAGRLPEGAVNADRAHRLERFGIARPDAAPG